MTAAESAFSAGHFPAAPSHLSTSSRRLWRQIVRRYELAPQEEVILGAALVLLDQGEAARKRLETDGFIVQGLHTVRIHPAVSVQRGSLLAAARLFHLLGVQEVASEALGRSEDPNA
jgi:phage terminase small subunit